MMRLTLLLLSSIQFCWVLSQPVYERIYSGGAAGKFNLIELNSGNVLTIVVNSFSINITGTSISNNDGVIIHSHAYYIDTFVVMQSIKKYTENEFYFVGGYWKDTCSTTGAKKTYPVIGRMDSIGNILSIHHYALNAPECSNMAGDLDILSGEGGAIAWGTRDYRFFALKVDAAGEPVWAKRFSHQAAFQFIKELPGGDLLAGINMDTAGAVVARMDANGNFLWCKSYIRPRGMLHDALIESDDAFIITGYTDSTASTNPFIPLPTTFQPKLFMMKLDGAGEVQWSRGYDSAPNYWYTGQSSRIVKALDGNYVVLATLGHPGYNFFLRPFLMKTDLNGDTLWTRSGGASGYDYFTKDLLAHSDGGYLISGGVWGDLPEMNTGLPYIFKTDSLGHFSCLERQHPVQVLDLFPTDSNFVLTSIDGATVHPAFVNDTIFDPINVYDACVVTSVQQYRPTKLRAMRVYPNPTLGRFTVEFADPLMAESYYSVYDAMGRLLYQRPLPTGATLEEVDLSRFGRGTYVLRVTDPEGQRHTRVVVE
ncbi:MAG: T9SS type A sorting domain-containing protein [Flavobacteriales bacterium]|nr:T9SS type A sorting domain-containing protein [Flavobacteriales bacterium]